MIWSANPSELWQVCVPAGAKKFKHGGHEYNVDMSKCYWLKARFGGRNIMPVLFYNEGVPNPVDYTYKFKEVCQFGKDEVFNFTGRHLYIISAESSTGRGIAALRHATEGPNARKMKWLFWLIVIGIIVAVLVLFGPQIAQGLGGLLK